MQQKNQGSTRTTENQEVNVPVRSVRFTYEEHRLFFVDCELTSGSILDVLYMTLGKVL